MPKPTYIKNCGITELIHINDAKESGANAVGFIHFLASPRHIAPEECAVLLQNAPCELDYVSVCVNPDDTFLHDIFSYYRPDFLQLHGTESPERVLSIKETFNVAIIKAISVRTQQDVQSWKKYVGIADAILFDTKTSDEELPGGMGHVFDWHILEGNYPEVPWLLSGGLNTENIIDALTVTQTPGIDVSSGIELHPGQKDTNTIRAFNTMIRDYDERIAR